MGCEFGIPKSDDRNIFRKLYHFNKTQVQPLGIFYLKIEFYILVALKRADYEFLEEFHL